MSVPRFFPRRLCNAISSRGKLSLAEMREVSHSNMCEGVLSSETKTPTVPPLQVLTCAIGRPRSDAVVSVSTTHAERPHLTNMTFTTAYRAGEGYQSWAISLNHIFASLQKFYEDLPNTIGGMLNSICKFGGPFQKHDYMTLDGKTLCWKMQQCK